MISYGMNSFLFHCIIHLLSIQRYLTHRVYFQPHPATQSLSPTDPKPKRSRTRLTWPGASLFTWNLTFPKPLIVKQKQNPLQDPNPDPRESLTKTGTENVVSKFNLISQKWGFKYLYIHMQSIIYSIKNKKLSWMSNKITAQFSLALQT